MLSEFFLESLSIVVVAYTYCCILVRPEQLLYSWYLWLWNLALKNKFKKPPYEVWWFRLAVYCEKCFAGQTALWFYIFRHGKEYDFLLHIVFVSFTIFTTDLLKKFLEKHSLN